MVPAPVITHGLKLVGGSMLGGIGVVMTVGTMVGWALKSACGQQMIRLRCPCCGKTYELPVDYYNQQVRGQMLICSGCKRTVRG